jgi:hypothetical protein
MTREQFIHINQWQVATFPESTALAKAYHLASEVAELTLDLQANRRQAARTEIADCFILLAGIVARHNMTFDDLILAIDEKMSVNRRRASVRLKPNANGVVNHI